MASTPLRAFCHPVSEDKPAGSGLPGTLHWQKWLPVPDVVYDSYV